MAKIAVIDLLMGSFENLSCLLVIEIIRIEIDDGLIRSLVFGMTDYAIISFVTMVTPIVRNTCGYLLMTGQAHCWRDFKILVVTLAAAF